MGSSWSPVIVGYDGSDGADVALEWAVDEARTRGCALRLVYAAQSMAEADFVRIYGRQAVPDRDRETERARDVLNAARARVAQQAPQVEVTLHMAEDTPSHTLVTESLHALMVVLGSRHRGRVGSLVLGSVGSAVAQRSGAPVVVVRGPAGDPAEGAHVVVGIDGRDTAEATLRFAFEHAATRGLALEAVLCWSPDPLAEARWRPSPPAPDRAEALASEVIAGWREKYPDVDVRSAVVRDHPVAGLVAASEAQDLLVVGRHGRHVLPGVVLGSTTMGVLHHATCPVAVVPEV